jgi:hypothetical protein
VGRERGSRPEGIQPLEHPNAPLLREVEVGVDLRGGQDGQKKQREYSNPMSWGLMP